MIYLLLITSASSFIIGFTLGISFISFDHKDKYIERRIVNAKKSNLHSKTY